MKNLLFTTHVFSIEEHDGVCSTSFERSFIQALEKMVKNKGMYVVANRQYEYGLSSRNLVPAPSPKMIVFGRAFSYEKAIKALSGEKLEYIRKKHEEEGYNIFVTNFKLARVIAVTDDVVVLSEKYLEWFLKGTKMPSPDKKIIFEDYLFELGRGIELFDVPKNENLQMQIEKLAKGNIDFIKINTFNFYEDGAIGGGEISPHYLFPEKSLTTREQAIRYFEGNKMMIKFLRQYVDEVYILFKENASLQRVPEKATFVSALTLKKWST